ncbi:hypothetical protein [Achromobacter insuavis]|uniref:hypothetical protein n=1 Tax=Achromobacter insuavis TaxID=1287735 RepID=UPI001EEB41E9|nr:hypothetical protein [Achromobacter insuavis]
MVEKKQRKPFYKSWGFWAILIVLGILLGGKNEQDTIASSAGTQSNAAVAVPELPKDQQEFVQIVASAQKQARNTENDMQRGGIKAARDQQICAVMKSRAVSGWIGTVKLVDANSDGKGVFTVEIAHDVRVKTWNNAFSDISDKTMFEPGSALFNTASQLKKGQRVKFSGMFLKGSQGECVREASISLSGKVQDPDFIFRFSSVEPL